MRQLFTLLLILVADLGLALTRGNSNTTNFALGMAISRETRRDKPSLYAASMSLKEQLFFFPNLSEGGEYRINFDAALVMDINRRFAWQVTLSDRYLSDPPGGFKQNDLLLTTGLKIKLGLLK